MLIVTTRKAVLSDPKLAYQYTKFVDTSPHPDITKVMQTYLLTNNEWAVKFFKEFGNMIKK